MDTPLAITSVWMIKMIRIFNNVFRKNKGILKVLGKIQPCDVLAKISPFLPEKLPGFTAY